MQSAVVWLVTTADLLWDGFPLRTGFFARSGVGRGALTGQALLELCTPGQSRVLRAVLQDVMAPSAELLELGIVVAQSGYVDLSQESTAKFEDKYWIVDDELLNWQLPDGRTIADWQFDAGYKPAETK